MKRPKHARARLLLAAAVGTVLAAAADTLAAITFNSTSSTVIITHDPDLSTTTDTPWVVKPTSVPSYTSILSPSPWQLEKTFYSGSSNSYAAGSLGQVTNSTTASFNLSPGTGVSQSDPAPSQYPGASSLLFNVDLWWNVGSGGFGPLANGYASFAVGGTLGTSAEVLVNLSFKDAAGKALRSDWVVDTLFPPGAFPTTFTTSKVLSTGSMASGTKIHLLGTIEFRASNDIGPTDFHFSRAEFGATPPTATFKTDAGGNWFDGNNWELINPAEDGLRSIANAPGDRALFYGTRDLHDPHTVTVSDNVTIGTLDVDGNAPYIFTPATSGSLNFQNQATSASNAVINIRHTNGNSRIQTPVILSNTTEMHTQNLSVLSLTNLISGPGGLQKLGSGGVEITSANNTFSGGVKVIEGVLTGSAFRSLGNGPVSVDGGVLVYNAGGAANGPVVVNSGTANVNAPLLPGDQFDIRAGGAIDGDPALVSGMIVGVNLLLSPQAMIVHRNPDNPNEGNPGGLGNSGQYIYGISGNFSVTSMVVGTSSGTPWMGIGAGFGEGISESDFGADFGVLQTAGSAVVSAVPGALLRMHSRIQGSGGLTKIGGGTVQLLNRTSTWTGGLNVASGTLAAAGDNVPQGLPNAINTNNITLSGGTFRADGIQSGSGLLMHLFNNDTGDQRRYWNPIQDGEGKLLDQANGLQEFIAPLKVSDQGQNGPDIRQLSRGVISNHENLSVMWTGDLHVVEAEAGTWQFATTGDDASVIWIDLNHNGRFENTGNPATTELIVDNNEYQGPTFRDNNDASRQGHPNLNLEAGHYNIAIGWSEGGISGEVSAQFKSPSMASMALIDPSVPTQAGIWSFSNADEAVKYDAAYGSNITVSGGTSSGIAVNARSAAFATLTLGANSTLSVTGSGPLKFASTTATGNVTIDNSVDVKTGPFGGSVGNLTKRGIGKLSLDGVSGPSGLSAASTISIQGGSLLARTQGAVNTINNATLSLEGGTFIAQGGGGAQNALRGSAHASADVRPATSSLSSANLATSTSTYDMLLTGDDPVFNAHFATALPDQFTAWWTGEFVALHTGDHYFKSIAGDDNAAIWIDRNQNGTFENDGDSRNPLSPGASELVNHWQCCGDSLESVGIFLRAGERYKVAFGLQDTAGGSGFGVQFREPGGTLTTINPFEQPGRWVINPQDGSNTPWLADVANFSGSAVRVTVDSAIDVQAASASFGALTINDGANLTVKGVGPAMFGDVTTSGKIGFNTQMHAYLGRLTTSSSLLTITKTGEAALILDGTSGPSALGVGSQVDINEGTLVATTNGANNPMGSAKINLATNTGLVLSSKVAANVTFSNLVSVAGGTADISAANRGRGAVDGANVTLNSLQVTSGTVNLGVGNNYSLNVANASLSGNVTLNNNSDDTRIALGNITGSSNLTLAGNNRTRITGNVSAASLSIKNPIVYLHPGTGVTRNFNVPNTTLYGAIYVQSGVNDFGSNTITGQGYLPGLNETWVNNSSFYEDTDISPNGTTRFTMGRQMGLRQANGVNVNSDSGWRLGWTNDDTYIYAGQMYFPANLPGGLSKVSMAEQFDDNVLIKIDGVTRLRNTQWDNATTTGAMTLPAGWHDVDIRVGQGGGGAGPSAQQSWPVNFGVVFDSQGRGDLDPSHYSIPIDPGDGTLFRSPATPDIYIEAGAELRVARLTGVRVLQFAGAGTSKLTLNALPALVVSDAVNVTVVSGVANLNVLSNNSLVLDSVLVAAGATLTKTGAGSLTIGGTFASPGSTMNIAGGTVVMNGNPGVPFSAAASGLSLHITGSTLRLGSDADFDELDLATAQPGAQTLDLNSPAVAGGYHAVRVYATDLNAAKTTLYAAIVNARTNPLDGIVDLNLHPGAAIGLAKIADYILIRPTKKGDVNLDGSVTIADFIDLASHFNTSGATWQEGDINYDGSVTIADFIDLAGNFNQAYSGESWGISPSEQTLLAEFAEAHGAAAPEPAMGLLMIGAVGLLARRRRSRRK